jgi:hypothetical protein
MTHSGKLIAITVFLSHASFLVHPFGFSAVERVPPDQAPRPYPFHVGALQPPSTGIW